MKNKFILQFMLNLLLLVSAKVSESRSKKSFMKIRILIILWILFTSRQKIKNRVCYIPLVI